MFLNLLSASAETTESITLPEGVQDAADAATEAINGNPFITALKDFFGKYSTPSNIISLATKILIAAFILFLGYICAKLISKWIIKAMEKSGTDPSVFGFMRTVIKTVVYVIAIISAISTLGIKTTSLLAALASVGVALGLGLQGSVSQLVSGIMIIVNKPFKKGDFVEVKGVSGTISGIYIMYTVLHTVDNKKVIVPNSDITSNYIINYSAEELRRCDVDISISYADDIKSARNVLLNVADKCPTAIKSPEPVAFVLSQDTSAITIQLRVWCNSSDYWDTFFFLQENTKVELTENGITIPFNQLDVHIIDKK